LAGHLLIPQNKIDNHLRPYLNQKVVLKTPTILKEQYLLPEHTSLLTKEIKEILEQDFIGSGLLIRLEKDDTFDFIADKINGFVKVLAGMKADTNLPEVITKLFEGTIERQRSELILIIPFPEQAENIRSWLGEFNLEFISVFSCTKDEWNRLGVHLAANLRVN